MFLQNLIDLILTLGNLFIALRLLFLLLFLLGSLIPQHFRLENRNELGEQILC
jgi:hypothetical protein